ncbi:hypothetical protein SEUCBS140593_000169 [Sporothrix eucalyptigena]|uniref:Autophagy-related protein 14 n=1 Tax=Sporothrix eucalyptigena TaxID=1812306 RepID=A0ABP0AMY5_9PEZI
MFLEGIALLSYNIAWACCSQGVSIGDKTSLEDTFNIGRNLYNLLIGNQLLNNPVGRIFPVSAATTPTGGSSPKVHAASSNNKSGSGNGSGNTDGKTPMPPSMGRYSHGTTHTFLGDDTVQGFKILSPNRLADRLKTKLTSETMPDWEVLEDDAWGVGDEDQDNMEDGVLNRVVVSPPAANQNGRGTGRGTPAGTGGVGGTNSGASGGVVVGSRVPEQRLFGVESVATVFPGMEDTVGGVDLENQRPGSRMPSDRPRGTGTKGWTKLRNRQ